MTKSVMCHHPFLERIFSKWLRWIGIDSYPLLDSLYIPLDRQHIRRTRNICLIPDERNRRGGKYSYAEWAHVIGIFQTLIFLYLTKKENNMILDVGCGTGLLGIACEPFLGRVGKYIGLDVMEQNIEFCRKHYPTAHFEFMHLNVKNPAYSPAQKETKLEWPVESESIDLVTALSVWTHLNEEDALFYFSEIGRVLKRDGKAIVTFFLLDEVYRSSLGIRSTEESRFHVTRQNEWVFDQPSYGSDAWFHTKWAEVPENAIGISVDGLDRLLSRSGMRMVQHYQGNWKEVPGVFFQDVLIFQKA